MLAVTEDNLRVRFSHLPLSLVRLLPLGGLNRVGVVSGSRLVLRERFFFYT